MQTRHRTALGTLATSAVAAVALGTGAAPASAAETTACPDSTRPAYAKVELFQGKDCDGGRMIVTNTEAAPDRADFRSFLNFNGKRYGVDNSRSSVRIAPKTCIRLWDGANFTGQASTNICAGDRVLEWNLARFDDRASSMKVFAAGGTTTPTPPSTPTPTPTTPTPPPAPATGSAGDRAASWAERQVGIREGSAAQRDWAKTYGRGVTWETYWCGIFVYNAFHRTGTPVKGDWSYTEWIYNTAKAGKQGLKAVPTSKVRRGDIVLMYRTGIESWRKVGHVGIALGSLKNGKIRTVQGNASNKVLIKDESVTKIEQGSHKRVVLIARQGA